MRWDTWIIILNIIKIVACQEDCKCKYWTIVRPMQTNAASHNVVTCCWQTILCPFCMGLKAWPISNYMQCVCEVSAVSSWLDLWLPTRRSQVHSPAWSRVELWVTFFRHTIHGQGHQAIGLISRHSIGGLKRTHALVDKSRLMPVLWSVNWSGWTPSMGF